MKLKGRIAISVWLALCIFFSITGLAFALPSDTQGHWSEKQISDWVNKGLAKGYTDGTFKPDNRITRAEFITLINKSFGFTESAPISFSDVSSTDWFFDEIKKAKAAGYISGYEDNTMRPDMDIERQEVAIILTRLLGLESVMENSVLLGFTDANSIPDWSKPSISSVVKNSLMEGYPDKTFRPLQPITRAEAVVCLERALGYKPLVFIKTGVIGTISKNGSPVKEAAVRVFKAGDYEVLKESATDDKGRFAVELFPGKYDLTANTADAVSFASDIEVKEQQVVTKNLGLEPAAVVSGTILDSGSQNKIVNTKVLFTTNPTFTGTTDNDAKYTIPVLPNRKYTVRVYNPSKPSESPSVVSSDLEVGNAGQQSLSTFYASFTATTTGGGGGGGHHGGGETVVPPVSDTTINNAIQNAGSKIELNQTSKTETAVTATQLNTIDTNNKPLEVKLQNNVEIELPPAAIDELRAAAPAQAQFKANSLSQSESQVYQPTNQSYQVAGKIFELKVQTVNNSSQVQTVTFSTPVSVTLPVDTQPNADEEVVIYKYNETTGTWEEIGGTYDAVNRTITFSRTTFSKYGPMKRSRAPKIDAAFITVGGVEYPVTITNRTTGVIDLRSLSPTATISAGRLTVSKSSVLTLTANLVQFNNFHLSISQTLNTGSNQLNVITYLGAVYPQGGLTLARVRQLFGGSDTLMLNGTLTDIDNPSYYSNVSLTFRLP